MVLEKIKAVLSEQFNVEESSITEATNLAEDLEADSLDLADLISTLEDDFDMEVDDEDLNDIVTVGDVVKCIENRMKN